LEYNEFLQNFKFPPFPRLEYAGIVKGLRDEIYFVPYIFESQRHAKVLVYNTSKPFGEWPRSAVASVAVPHREVRKLTLVLGIHECSWHHAHAEQTDDLDTRGYVGGATLGNYIYFAPMSSNGKEYHARGSTSFIVSTMRTCRLGRFVTNMNVAVLRFDMTRELDDPEAWEAYDAANTGGYKNVMGYAGAIAVEPYVYFVPTAFEKTRLGWHGSALSLSSVTPSPCMRIFTC
jgi:hypothetical protein